MTDIMNYRLCERKCQWRYYDAYQAAQEYRQLLRDWCMQVGPVQVRCSVHGWAEAIKGGTQCLECLIDSADHLSLMPSKKGVT